VRDFVYVAPPSLAAAIGEMRHGEARPLAGGTDLLPQVREGRRGVDRIVDLKRIGKLAGVQALPDGGVEIGATLSASRVARHPAIATAYPAIAASARLIGSVQVQNRASLGGNVCNAAPSADAVPALICHQAIAQIAGGDGGRQVPLEEFFLGPSQTVLKRDELLVSLSLAAVPPRSATTYLRFTPRREMDIAIAGVAVRIDLAEDGTIAFARVVMASVAPTPLRAPSAERLLTGNRPDRELALAAARAAASDARPISDTRGSADYRRTLVEVLTRRSFMASADRLKLAIEQP
jgi:CO/xanthine dehydrogenase FAD-binding subunit